MDQRFWQGSPESLTYEDIASFIAEGVPEGDHLEYKLPTYNNSNHKVEFTPQFLETIVTFTNTGEGIMIVGIREDAKTKRPMKVEGIDLSDEKRPRDLAISLRDACALAIEPTVSLEARAFIIPEDEDAAGHTLLVVRVRRGLQPPYNLLQHGILFVTATEMIGRACDRFKLSLLIRKEQRVSGHPVQGLSSVHFRM